MLPGHHAILLHDLRELAFRHQFLSPRKRERQFFGDAGDDQMPERMLLADIKELGIELVQRHRMLAGRLLDIVDDFTDRGKRMDHRRHRTDTVKPIKAINGLGHVRKADQHPVPRTYAQGKEGACRAVDLLCESAVRDFPAHERQGWEIRIGSSGLEDSSGHRPVGIIQMKRDLAIAVQPRRGNIVIVESHSPG